MGDRLLVAVASLRQEVLGGDEFAIVLEGLQSLTEAHNIAEMLAEELCNNYLTNIYKI